MARFGRLGWILGLIFGTIFGVLFAPRKGKELRNKMKADRKKGGLGVAPLQDDMKHLGREIASLARDIYESDTVQDVVEKGRKKMKELSNDFVGEVHDFHNTRIKPLQAQVQDRVKWAKGGIRRSKKRVQATKRKAKETVRIGKRAFAAIKRVVKKKSS